MADSLTACTLRGFGKCRGKLSREHYFSKTILQKLTATKAVSVRGLPWQPPDTLQPIGISSLTAKILCEGHNNGLTGLDSAGGAFFDASARIDDEPEDAPQNVRIDGPKFERWLLKVVFGAVAGAGLGNGLVASEWKRVLAGAAWPDGWGLYLNATDGLHHLPKDFAVEFFAEPSTGETKLAGISVAGIRLWMDLGKPSPSNRFDLHRPRGIVVNTFHGQRNVEFVWLHKTNKALTLTKLGATTPIQS